MEFDKTVLRYCIEQWHFYRGMLFTL